MTADNITKVSGFTLFVNATRNIIKGCSKMGFVSV